MRFTLKSNINYQEEIIYVGVKIKKGRIVRFAKNFDPDVRIFQVEINPKAFYFIVREMCVVVWAELFACIYVQYLKFYGRTTQFACNSPVKN